jgi:putative intracellular protease/amidase
LRSCGANYQRGEKNWGAYVVRDGNLISGQNPASSIPMAESIIAALSQKKILIVLSAASEWTRADGSKYPSGYWTEEFVDVHEKFVAAGFTVDIATPAGKKPTADPHSLSEKFAGARLEEFKHYLASLSEQLDHPLVLANIDMATYDAVVIPGGHGPVEDLYKDKDMGRVLTSAEKSDKIIGTVCHGQAALLSATDEKGNWLFKGAKLTAFSDEEEIEFGTAANAPWLLASRLRSCGAVYQRGEKNWGAYVVKDGNMISGQNPASSIPMAQAIIAELNQQLVKPAL